MLLNEKDTLRKDLLDNQIRKLNLDISILNGISGKSQVPDQLANKKIAKFTLNQLAQVLKDKNHKSAHLQSQKPHVKQWLKYKGVNLRKIQQQIYENAKITAELGIYIQPLKSEATTSFVQKQSAILMPEPQPLTGFTLESQEEFINKQKQVGINRQTIKSMQLYKTKNNFRNILLNKINESHPSNETSHNKSMQPNISNISFSRDSERMGDQTRKNQYFDFVERIAKQNFDDCDADDQKFKDYQRKRNVQLFGRLKEIKPFWKIVLTHIKAVQEKIRRSQSQNSHVLSEKQLNQQQLNLNSHIMCASLKAIQQQFLKKLPDTSSSYAKLDAIISSMKERNTKLKVWRNSHGEPTWARAYMLLRAGKQNQVIRLINAVDQEFADELLKHEESLKTTPTPSDKIYNQTKYKDSFYSQLLYILKGESKFEPEIIQQGDMLTKTWILLRTLGVYRYDPEMKIEEKFSMIGRSIVDAECRSDLGLQMSTVENLLHLGLYKDLIYLVEMIMDRQVEKELGDMNEDDYIHLLEVVSVFPELWGDSSKRERVGIRAKLSHNLGRYMASLRHDGFGKETAKYLMLATENSMNDVACSFIRTRSQYEAFDWDSFKHLLKEQRPTDAKSIYLNLSKSVLENIKLRTFEDFLFAANLYKSKFIQQENSFFQEQKCYVKLLIKHLFFVQKKKYLAVRHQPLQELTGQMFEFFEISPQERQNQVKLQEKDEEIKRNVKECELLLRQEIDFDCGNSSYVEQVVQPFLFYETVNELGSLLQNPYVNVSELKRFDNAEMYRRLKSDKKPLEHLANLLIFFIREFDSETTPLFVFYLNMLIERKRIICKSECDYSGLADYIEKVMRNLEGLDILCQDRVEQIRLSNYDNEQEQKYEMRMSMNILPMCEEFREFMDEMHGELEQRGGMYGLGLERNHNGKMSNRNAEIVF